LVTVTMKELLEAGVHFGHQVRRWNPKMKEYIFGERNGIYIIDLQKTQKLFRDALNYTVNFMAENPNAKVLFVGTKRQAQDAIAEEALRCGQYFINNRWLGGLMTNYQTVQLSIKKMKEIEAMKEDGRFEMLTKKERLQLDKTLGGLIKNLGGIRDMNRLPDLLFIIDVRKEEIAVAESNRLNIPIVAVVDTNCSPEGIDAVIPGNDDALRAIRLFASRIADAIIEGKQVGTEGNSSAVEVVETEEVAEIPAAVAPIVEEVKAIEPVAVEAPKVEEVVEEPKAEVVAEPIVEASKAEVAETVEEPKVEEVVETVEDAKVEVAEVAATEPTAEENTEATAG
jgi:small subunit ribosomal protein S2